MNILFSLSFSLLLVYYYQHVQMLKLKLKTALVILITQTILFTVCFMTKDYFNSITKVIPIVNVIFTFIVGGVIASKLEGIKLSKTLIGAVSVFIIHFISNITVTLLSSSLSRVAGIALISVLAFSIITLIGFVRINVYKVDKNIPV